MEKINNLNKKLNNNGQAIFELIVFMPFLIYLTTVFFNIGNAINSSINQQKATRGYHYHLLKGNSTAPTMSDLQTFQNNALGGGSMVVTGWQEKTKDSQPLAPCFKFSTLFGGSGEETCESGLKQEEKSKFIRTYTVYGICGADYIKGGASDFYIRNAGAKSTADPFQACARD